MTRIRLFLMAVLLAACVGLMAAIPLVMPPRSGVTKANFDRIEKGMTRAEVEQLFGKKGEFLGVYEGAIDVIRFADNGLRADIQFFDDCVTDKDWWDSNEPLFDKFRRWLHLR